jgi:DNA-binding protein, histone-like, putative
MSKYYSTWKKKFKDASGVQKELYYACSKRGQVVGFNELASIITESTTLTAPDVKACLMALSQNVKNELKRGNTVRLDDIGTFSIALSSQGYPESKDITADKVKATKIVFKPDKEFRSVLAQMRFSSLDKEASKIKGLQL